MIKEDFIARDGIVLKAYLFDEVENPIGVIQFAHGMQEYCRNYFAFAEFMQSKGFIVYMIDQRAHGKSCESIKQLGKVNGDVFAQTVNDQLDISKMLNDKYGLPIYYIGHSYGSFIGQEYLKHNIYAKKIVLIGSCYMHTLKVWFAKLITKIFCFFKGKDSYARFIEKQVFLKYKKQFTTASWITSDEEQTKFFYQDILNGKPFSIGFYKSMFSHQFSLTKNIKVVSKELPILLMSGSDDPVGERGKGISKLQKFYTKNNLNSTLVIYKDKRHSLLHETDKEQIFEDIVVFLKDEI